MNKGQAVFRTYTTLGRCLSALPEPVALSLASAVGDVMFHVRADHRRMVSKNLARVLGADIAGAESDPGAVAATEAILDHWARRSFRAYARYWVEGARLGRTSPAEVEQRTYVQGLEHLVDGMAAGKGVIMALPHVGSWEFGGAFLATQDLPMTAVAERIEPPELFEFFVQERAAMGLTIVPLDSSSGSSLMSILRQGRLVGLLSDRDLVGNGIEVEFFGETTTMPAGPATLALRTGAQLVTGVVYSGPGADHRAVVEAPLDTTRQGTLRQDVARLTQGIATRFEGLIRRAPDQWHVFQPLWLADRTGDAGITKFENRPLAGDADFEALGPSVVTNRRVPARRPPSRPVPDLLLNGQGAQGEPRFHSLTEHDFDVVAVVSAEGRFIFVSASAERLFGFDISNVVGLDAFGLFDALSVEPVKALFKDLVARRRLSVSLEMGTVRADGTPLELEVVAANHLDDPIGGIVVNIRDVTEHKSLEQKVRDVDRHQSTIIESLADGVMMVDPDGTVVGVNQAFEVMFEAPRVRLIGRQLGDLMAAASSVGVEVIGSEGEPVDYRHHPIGASLRGGRRSVGVVIGIRRGTEPPMWVRTNAQAMVSADGAVTGAVVSFSDITAARRSATELRREEQFLQVLLDTLEEGIVACDADGRVTVFNPAARFLHGLAEDEDPIGSIPTDQGLFRADGSPMAPRENPLIRAMSGEQLRDVQIILESRSGDRRKVSVNGQSLVDDDGWMLGAVVAMHDVTEQKLNEERLAEMALHDPLTGLANRTLLAERLQEAIDALARQSPGLPDPSAAGEQPGVAVYLLDLDEFKEINDVLGHDVGDDMLIAVARRLTAIVRPSDTVARLGGDEFVVVCDIESGEEEMLRIAERISTALARPYRIDGRTLTVLASVGGVFADNADTDPSRLLSRADDAMYGVKWSRRRERRSMMD